MLPLTAFYDTPSPLPAGTPGELIRSEQFDQYQLPLEVSAVRILYHSRSANGEDVAASGVVLFPYRSPPAGGWPIIAWAHGFTGTARRCAPSLMRNVYEGPFLSMYVKLGYAVVATDYVGLGTSFRNAFIDMESNAADVIYSIPAARAAVPTLGTKWVAMGNSGGTLAALEVADLEHGIGDPSYLGSVAIMGVGDMEDAYRQLFVHTSPSMFIFLAYGIKTIYPAFQVDDVLTEKALALYDEIDNVCAAVPSGLPADQLLKADWQTNSFVKRFFSRNTLGQKPTYGPLLVIAGEIDPLSLKEMTMRSVTSICRHGGQVQLYTYDGPSAEVLGDSAAEQITWIRERFSGRNARSDCR